MSRQDEVKVLIYNHGRRLQKLREKRAKLGISTDPRFDIEIDELEEEIEKLQMELIELDPGEENPISPGQPGVAILIGEETLQITIKGNLKDFSDQEEEKLRRKIADLVEGSFTMIKIISKNEGSIVLGVKIPAEWARKLIELYEANDPRLDELGIEQIKKISEDKKDIDLESLSDEKLLEIIKQEAHPQAQEDAFTIIYKRYNEFVTSLIKKSTTSISLEDTEDVLIEVWFTVVMLLDSSRPIPVQTFKAWLLGVVRAKIADFYRRQARLKLERTQLLDAVSKDIAESILLDIRPVESQVFTQRDRDKLSSLIDSELTRQEHRVLLLNYSAGIGSNMIANILDIESSTVRKSRQRALEKLRRKLDQETGQSDPENK